MLAEDDDACKRMMTLAEDRDPGRKACSCWNNMILLGNKEPLFKDHLGTTSGPFSAKSENEFPVVWASIWVPFCCWKLGYTGFLVRLQNAGCHMFV